MIINDRGGHARHGRAHHDLEILEHEFRGRDDLLRHGCDLHESRNVCQH